ncbi:MAG: hypothetical protein H0T46_02090 [Deltaproteobacteria bacterium]|nr:hypothetical protein [Deltaproteobacteria bacterium]
MNVDRVCAKSGLLVDGDTRLLTDPSEYFHCGVDVQAGCGRLRCANCKAWVRGGPPGLGINDEVQVDVRKLYAAPDWSVLPYIEKPFVLHNRMRFYTCLCTTWEAESNEPVDNDREFESDPRVPWACAGHPVPKLPLALKDFTIDAKMRGVELVDKVLRGACPRELDRPFSFGPEPGVWLAWLYVYLQGLAITDQLSAAIADRLTDPDPHVVGRVLYYFSQFPRAAGIEKLVAKAEADPHRVAVGYPIPEHRSALTLWGVLVERLKHAPKQRDELDARIQSLITKLLFIPLSSLPHDDVGPTTTAEFEGKRRATLRGWDAAGIASWVEDFARARKLERIDAIGDELARSPGIFDDPEMRQYIADHIIEIDAAAPGRWRQAMTLLTDWIHKPEEGHLIVIAGSRIIQARLVPPAEFRTWIKNRRDYGWVRDEWVLPLETMLKQS